MTPQNQQESTGELTPTPDETPMMEVPAQMVYGISCFQMEDDHPVVHVTGAPDLGQLHRLLTGALAGIESEMIAQKVVEVMNRPQTKFQSLIVKPGQ